MLLPLLIVLSGSFASSESFTDVLIEHGISENIDQWGHYLLGKKLVFDYIKHENLTPCEAKQRAMDYAIKREFDQKTIQKQESGTWCKVGCRRDLYFWQIGMDFALTYFGVKASECKIKEWQPPANLPDVQRPLLPSYNNLEN